MENRTLILNQYLKLIRLVNLGNKRPDEKTQIHFEILSNDFESVLFAIISKNQKVRLCYKEYPNFWQACNLLGISDLEEFFCAILNDMDKKKISYKTNDLLISRIELLLAFK